jgi:hypothetical protein
MFFLGAAAGGAASLAVGKIARPKQETQETRPRTKAGGYSLSEHARKYYRSAKV